MSKPIRLALCDEVLREDQTVFDYGCGHGGDVRRLRERGFEAGGWDPAHAPDAPRVAADVVNLGYVLNVIEAPGERDQVLETAWSMAKQTLLIAVRSRHEKRRTPMDTFADGYVSSRDTFQKFYSQHELADWVESLLGKRPVPAAPGIFFMFREDTEQERYLLSRYGPRSHADRRSRSLISYEEHREALDELVKFVEREERIPANRELDAGAALSAGFGSLRQAFQVARRALALELATPKRSQLRERFERHRHLLMPLASFIEEHGRPPDAHECETSDAVLTEFGSVGRAVSVIKRVFGPAWFQEALERVRGDFLVYMALARFGRRPSFSALPLPIQRDIRAVFGSYREACKQGDELLFSAGSLAGVAAACNGTDLPQTTAGLIVPMKEITGLPPLLRVYEGCASAYLGIVEDATAVRLSTNVHELTYLCATPSAADPFPVLQRTLRVRLRGPRVRVRDWEQRADYPVILNKRMVGLGDDAEVDKQDRFLRRLSATGTELPQGVVARRSALAAKMEARGVGHRGHQILRGDRPRPPS